MSYTKEQKKEYFAKLRERWAENKKRAEDDTEARGKYDAIVAEAPSYGISYYSFYLTLQAMKANGWDGTPYIDTKTFKGWKEAGFIVKKGEKSKIDGITWLEIKDKEAGDDDDGFLLPKLYHLFHRSQVEAL
jgi:hypothetical protein